MDFFLLPWGLAPLKSLLFTVCVTFHLIVSFDSFCMMLNKPSFHFLKYEHVEAPNCLISKIVLPHVFTKIFELTGFCSICTLSCTFKESLCKSKIKNIETVFTLVCL